MLRTTWLIVVALLVSGALAGAEAFGDGTYMVGQEVQPGIYEAQGGEACVWFLHRGGNRVRYQPQYRQRRCGNPGSGPCVPYGGLRHVAFGGRAN